MSRDQRIASKLIEMIQKKSVSSALIREQSQIRQTPVNKIPKTYEFKMDNALIVVAKKPSPGHTKTRLCPPLIVIGPVPGASVKACLYVFVHSLHLFRALPIRPRSVLVRVDYIITKHDCLDCCSADWVCFSKVHYTSNPKPALERPGRAQDTRVDRKTAGAGLGRHALQLPIYFVFPILIDQVIGPVKLQGIEAGDLQIGATAMAGYCLT
jgi:hypothetical protein